MEEFISNLSEKVGIDRATAEKVVDFIKDHLDDLPGLLGGAGGVGGMLGGLADKAKGLLGGD